MDYYLLNRILVYGNNERIYNHTDVCLVQETAKAGWYLKNCNMRVVKMQYTDNKIVSLLETRFFVYRMATKWRRLDHDLGGFFGFA